MSASKLAKPLSESDLTSVFDVISAKKLKGSVIAARDYVMVRGSYLLGVESLNCAVSVGRTLSGWSMAGTFGFWAKAIHPAPSASVP